MNFAIDRTGICESLGFGTVFLGKVRETFSANLTRIMQAKDLKNVELAKRLGVHKSVITHWKSGSILPEAKSLDALAEALEVPHEELFRQVQTDAPVTDRDLDTILRELAQSRGYELVKKSSK